MITQYIWDLYNRIGKLTESEFKTLITLVCPNAMTPETSVLILEHLYESGGILIPPPDPLTIPSLREIVLWAGLFVAIGRSANSLAHVTNAAGALWHSRRLWTRVGAVGLRAIQGIGIVANLWGPDAIDYITEEGLLGSEFIDDVVSLIPVFWPIMILETLGDLGATIHDTGENIMDWANSRIEDIQSWTETFNIFEPITIQTTINGQTTYSEFDLDSVFFAPVNFIAGIAIGVMGFVRGVGDFISIVGEGLEVLDTPKWVDKVYGPYSGELREGKPGESLLTGEVPKPVDLGLGFSGNPWGGFHL